MTATDSHLSESPPAWGDRLFGLSRLGLRRRIASSVGSGRGSVSVEFAITMSAVIVSFFVLLVGAGRVIQQENDVRSAAHAAARAASLRDGFADAQADVQEIAARNLSESGVSCEDRAATITSSAADFVPGGVVTVRVECTARPVGMLGLPANRYHYEATEAIDVFRSEP